MLYSVWEYIVHFYSYVRDKVRRGDALHTKVCLTAIWSGGCHHDLRKRNGRAHSRIRVPGRRFCQLQGCCGRDGKETAVTKCLFQLGSSLRATAHATGHVWSREPQFEEMLRSQLEAGLDVGRSGHAVVHRKMVVSISV